MCEQHVAPFDALSDAFFNKVSQAVWLANRSGGKCHVPSDLIQDTSGRWRPIGAWRGGRTVGLNPGGRSRPPLAPEGYALGYRASLPAQAFGSEPCVRVETASGFVVTVTAWHPLLTPDGWRQASNLKCGDRVGTAGRMPAPRNSRRLPPGLAFFGGLMAGDGDCRRATFSGRDPAVRAWLTALALRQGWRTHTTGLELALVDANRRGRWSEQRDGKVFRGRFRDTPRGWLRRLGLFHQGAHTKRAPKALWSAPADDIAAFVSGLLATDGSVDTSGRWRVEWYSVSRELLQDVKWLLLRLGVVARLTVKVGRYRGQSHRSWRLTCDGAEARRLAPWLSGPGARLAGAIHCLGRAPQVHRGRSRRKGDVYWDHVAHIVDVGRHAVVNVEVPGTEVFVANGGVISHNTRCFSILHHADSTFKRACWTLHAATQEAQAKICKGYVDEYLAREEFAGDQGPPHASNIVRYARTGARLDIRPGTIGALSGPKPQVTGLDEVEFLRWENLQQAIGMAHSLPDVPALIVFGSTRQRIFGSMARLTENAARMGLKTYGWCVWETIARCPIRSRKCALWNRCEGWRCQKGDGYWDVNDVIMKSALADDEVWSTQYACARPSRSGLVFPSFDEMVHVHEKWEYRPSLPVEIAVDWGYTSPAVIGFYQRTGEYRYMFDIIYVQYKLHVELLELVREKLAHYQCRLERGWGDPEDAAANALFRRELRTAWVAGNQNLQERLTAVRTALRDGRGRPTIFFHPRCAVGYREFSLYHNREVGLNADGTAIYDETPVDEDNHFCDQLGYYCWGTRARQTVITLADVMVRPTEGRPTTLERFDVIGEGGGPRVKQF